MMANEISLLGALIVGLLGSPHCIGMCGGIVGVLSMSIDSALSNKKKFQYYILYNIGRLGSYMIAGGIIGVIGSALMLIPAPETALFIGRLISSAFLLALGLSIAGIWNGLSYVEKSGALIWKKIEPLSRKILPLNKPYKALLLGVAWGWLPCGLVYTMLSLSFASGSLKSGSLIMLFFGLGTLPTLLLMSTFAVPLKKMLQQKTVRLIAGLILILLAILGFLSSTEMHRPHPQLAYAAPAFIELASD